MEGEADGHWQTAPTYAGERGLPRKWNTIVRASTVRRACMHRTFCTGRAPLSPRRFVECCSWPCMAMTPPRPLQGILASGPGFHHATGISARHRRITLWACILARTICARRRGARLCPATRSGSSSATSAACTAATWYVVYARAVRCTRNVRGAALSGVLAARSPVRVAEPP